MKSMTAFIAYAFFMNFLISANASEIAQEIIDGLTDTGSSPTKSASSEFAHEFKSFDSASKLSEAVSRSISEATESGRLSILVCDIDETLVKRDFGYPAPTNLYKNLRKLDVFAKSHIVLALTARLMRYPNIVDVTNTELKTHVPDFFDHLYSDKKSESPLPDFSDEKRFLHHNGLIIMGNGELGSSSGISKKQALDLYLEKVLITDDKKYELIFLDNELTWFPEFRTSSHNPNILKGHFFHYLWLKGEKFTPFPRIVCIPNRLHHSITLPALAQAALLDPDEPLNVENKSVDSEEDWGNELGECV